MTKPLAVFFDWDGTLVDSFTLIQSGHNYAHEQLKLEKPSGESWFKPLFGKPREQIYETLYKDRKTEAQKHFEFFVKDNHVKAIQPMEGARELLQNLKDLHIPTCVVTNKRNILIQREVAHLGWAELLAAVVGSGDTDQDKPSREPVEKAAQLANLDCENLGQTFYIGDSDTDLICGYNSGCQTFLIDGVIVSEDVLKSYPPLKTFKNCAEIQDYLLQTV